MNKLDADKDGKITAAEIKTYLKEAYYAGSVAHITATLEDAARDAKNDGKIDPASYHVDITEDAKKEGEERAVGASSDIAGSAGSVEGKDGWTKADHHANAHAEAVDMVLHVSIKYYDGVQPSHSSLPW